MTNPLISVIIPTYNREKTILRSVMSVLNQTYKNLELIVVDDCSTDNTIDILKKIKDNRLIILKHYENRGQNAARNTGIIAAKGEFIAHHDSDDVWHLDKLEKQLSIFFTVETDILCCQTAVHDESNNTYMYNFPNLNYVSTGYINYFSLLKYNCTTTQTLFGKSECFKETMFDSNQPRFTDWALSLDLVRKYKLYFDSQVLVDVFQQKDSITKNPQKGVAGMKLLFEKHKDGILSAADITESFFKKMSSFTCRCGKNPVMEMTYIYKAHKSFSNLLKLIMARIGFYRIFFNFMNS